MRRLDNVPVASLELYYACMSSQCFPRLQTFKKKKKENARLQNVDKDQQVPQRTSSLITYFMWKANTAN